MKKLLLLSAVIALAMPASIQTAAAQDVTTAPAAHAEHAQHEKAGQETLEAGWLKQVEAKYVCMMNNAVFEKEQMAIEVDGKTYYGCCSMCKDRLQKDASARQATDPVSGNTVDKATAIIGEHHGAVYYFENEENFHKFASGPMPEMYEHMEGMDHGAGGETEAPAAPKNHEEHH